MKIKKGDNVIVISGKDKGKSGKVLRAFPKLNQILIENINIKKKHQKPRKSGEKGQIIEIPFPIDISNAMIIDPKTKKPTRIKIEKIKGKNTRVTKKSNTVLD
jgi:large subunit ribosomal protein L24